MSVVYNVARSEYVVSYPEDLVVVEDDTCIYCEDRTDIIHEVCVLIYGEEVPK